MVILVTDATDYRLSETDNTIVLEIPVSDRKHRCLLFQLFLETHSDTAIFPEMILHKNMFTLILNDSVVSIS